MCPRQPSQARIDSLVVPLEGQPHKPPTRRQPGPTRTGKPDLRGGPAGRRHQLQGTVALLACVTRRAPSRGCSDCASRSTWKEAHKDDASSQTIVTALFFKISVHIESGSADLTRTFGHAPKPHEVLLSYVSVLLLLHTVIRYFAPVVEIGSDPSW